MPAREYHEALWEALPRGLEPPRFAERLAFVRARVRPGERLLDLGCGEGRFAEALAAAGVHVVCAEVAREPLRRMREVMPAADTLLLDGEGAWELKDASFDAVWAGEVIEHVADTARWLSELRRVLRPCGTLLLSTPAHGALELLRLTLSRRARERELDPRGDHLRFYTSAALRALLADFGFEAIELSVLGGARDALGAHGRTLLLSALRSRF